MVRGPTMALDWKKVGVSGRWKECAESTWCLWGSSKRLSGEAARQEWHQALGKQRETEDLGTNHCLLWHFAMTHLGKGQAYFSPGLWRSPTFKSYWFKLAICIWLRPPWGFKHVGNHSVSHPPRFPRASHVCRHDRHCIGVCVCVGVCVCARVSGVGGRW